MKFSPIILDSVTASGRHLNRKGDVRKKVNNESMTVKATFLTTLDGQVSQG